MIDFETAKVYGRESWLYFSICFIYNYFLVKQLLL